MKNFNRRKEGRDRRLAGPTFPPNGGVQRLFHQVHILWFLCLLWLKISFHRREEEMEPRITRTDAKEWRVSTTESTKGTKMKISENFVISLPFVVKILSFQRSEDETEPRITPKNAKGRWRFLNHGFHRWARIRRILWNKKPKSPSYPCWSWNLWSKFSFCLDEEEMEPRITPKDAKGR